MTASLWILITWRTSALAGSALRPAGIVSRLSFTSSTLELLSFDHLKQIVQREQRRMQVSHSREVETSSPLR